MINFKKMNISEVSEFLILIYIRDWKLENLGKCYFTSIFGSIWNPRSKNQKENRKKGPKANKIISQGSDISNVIGSDQKVAPYQLVAF